jgi:hypothetical protein
VDVVELGAGNDDSVGCVLHGLDPEPFGLSGVERRADRTLERVTLPCVSLPVVVDDDLEHFPYPLERPCEATGTECTGVSVSLSVC